MLKQECIEKSKLRTFLLFKDFDEPAAYVRKPLTFQQRRIIAKLRLGCLPLRIETGRYTRPKLREEERTCLVCAKNNLVDISGNNASYVEDEAHFMFNCEAYKTERDHWLNHLVLPTNFETSSIADKFKVVLNLGPNIRATSQFILGALNKRSLLLL